MNADMRPSKCERENEKGRLKQARKLKHNTSLLNCGRFQTSSAGNLRVAREDTCTCTWEGGISPATVDYGEGNYRGMSSLSPSSLVNTMKLK